MIIRRFAHALLILAVAALLLSIWAPIGSWWQWLATAPVLLFIAAMILGRKDD